MRAEILNFQAAAAPELPLQAAAPLIHSGRRLAIRIGSDGAGRRRGGTHSRSERIGQSWNSLSDREATGQNCSVGWVRVQERIAIGLVGVVVDAAAGAEHSLLRDAISNSEPGRPVCVIGAGE